MENISIRLPYVEEATYECWESPIVQSSLSNAKQTDLSNMLDKDRNRFKEKAPTIMLIYKSPNHLIKINKSYKKRKYNDENVVEYKTWYEYLLPILKLSPEDFKKITKTTDKDNIVEFGCFPSTIVNDINEEERLRQCKRKFTGNRYTLPVGNYYKGGKKVEDENKGEFVAKRIVDLESFPEYEIDGERYIDYRELGTSKSYLFRIEPLSWHIDSEKSELVCANLPVSGIIYDSLCSIKMVSYNDSLVRKYLEGNFLKEAILNHIKQEEKLPEQTSEVTELLKKIRTYKEQYHGKEDINEIIRDIIRKYNEDLESLKSKSGLTLYTEEGLYLKLLSDLNRILDKLKRSSESSKEYCDILKLIEDSIDTLEGQQKETDNELLKDIQKISTEILPKLSNNPKKQEEFKQRIFEELRNDRDKVKSYLEYMNTLSKEITLRTSKNLGFKTLKEYETNFRIRLHPILESIRNTSLEEEKLALIDNKNKLLKELSGEKLDRDLVNFELYRILESLYRNDFQESRIINVLLNEINSLVKELRSYSVRPEPAFSINIPSDNIEDIVNTLNVIIINLHKMILTTKESQEKHIRLSKYKISI